jgi:glycerophosphoryl diester phosphodiesterase
MKHPFLKSNRKMIISHRGNLFGKDPQTDNTIRAFIKCMDIPILNGIELDVDQTKDGCLVLYHRKSKKDLPASGLTFSQLKKKKNIPTLDSALKAIKNHWKKRRKGSTFFIDVEIKKDAKYQYNYAAAYEYDVMTLLKSYFRYSEFFISSFKFSVLKNIMKQYPKVTCGLLLDRKRIITDEMIQTLDFIAPRFNYFEFYRNIKKPFLLWTVNGNHLHDFLNGIPEGHAKVKGLITDEAGKLH